MPTTIITGATSGIGLETAKGLAKKQHKLILVSRNMSKLESTKRILENLKAILEVCNINVLFFNCSKFRFILKSLKRIIS